MKYKTVKVDQDQKGQFHVWIHRCDGVEREDTVTQPNAIGFYHYPESMDDKRAAAILVNKMMEVRFNEIKKLVESIVNLHDVLPRDYQNFDYIEKLQEIVNE